MTRFNALATRLTMAFVCMCVCMHRAAVQTLVDVPALMRHRLQLIAHLDGVVHCIPAELNKVIAAYARSECLVRER